MENKKKIILSLYGGTGSWEKKYKENGYTVYNITLPEYDVNEYTFEDGILYFDTDKRRMELGIKISDIYGILAAPPCTEFSIMRNDKTSNRPRDFIKGMKNVLAALSIIWECRYRKKIKFWALENPRGFLRQFLGKPYFEFKAYEFGHLWVKPTDIWGYFNKPIKRPLGELLEPLIDRDYIKSIPNSKQGAIDRAITPSGFATAFYKANK